MTKDLCSSLKKLGCSLATPFVALVDGISDLFGASIDPDDSQLTEAELERIRQSLWRIRRDFEAIGGAQFFEELTPLLKDAFGGPEGFVRSVGAWVVLIDSLVLEAESEFGSASGRGPFKKRHVKAALLYLVRRLNINFPRTPAFIEPIVWDVLLDSAIDTLAQFSNRNRRWGDVPANPSFRARVNLGAQHVARWTEGLTGLLTRIAWWFVLRSSPVSPKLKSAVDNFVAADPDPLRSIVVLAEWAARHGKEMVALTDLLSTAFLEAQFVMAEDPQRRLVYAREIVMAFIAESGSLPPQGSLAYDVIDGLIGAGIEIVAKLFEKRGPGAAVTPPEEIA